MSTITVIAKSDIKSSRGLLLAALGAKGVALPNRKPSRQVHYGMVPVRWRGRQRAFWVSPEFLEASESLERCIAAPPSVEVTEILEIPSGDDFSDSNFGINLKLIRRVRRLSQEELASRMGRFGVKRVSQTVISNWERRKDCPSGKLLRAAAKALGVPMAVFVLPLQECDAWRVVRRYLDDLEQRLCLK